MNPKAIMNQARGATISIGPGETIKVRGQGSFIRIVSSSSSSPLLVSADNSQSWPMGAGERAPVVSINEAGQYVPYLFSFVEFENPTLETIEITFSISIGDMSGGPIAIKGSIQTDPSGPSIVTPEPLAVGTPTLATPKVLQADVRIKERIIQNTGNYPVWYGDSSVDPAVGRGTFLEVGGTTVLPCWGAVYFKADGGATRISINNILKQL